MAAESDVNMYQQIGELTAKVEIILEMLRRSEEKSDTSRSSMYRQIEAVTQRMGILESQVASIHEDVSEMKPVVDEVEAWRQRGIGGLAVVGIGASAVTFILTQYFTSILAWFGKS